MKAQPSGKTLRTDTNMALSLPQPHAVGSSKFRVVKPYWFVRFQRWVIACCRQKNVNSLYVVDRETGELLEEKIPAYLKAVYTIFYHTKPGREIIQLGATNSLLSWETDNHGKRMNDPKVRT